VSRAAALATIGAVAALTGTWFSWQGSTAPATTDRTAPQAAEHVDGAALFASKGCATCHNGPGSTAQMGEFPDLSDASAWAGTRKSGYSAEDYVRESMLAPNAFISPEFTAAGPTSGMPTLKLTQVEVDALVTYLLTG
jgi:mono/diheme cytochrome c family protein